MSHASTGATTVDLRDLDRIDAQVSRLFALVADGLAAATAAFLAADRVAVERVVHAELAIDEIHTGIEQLIDDELVRVGGAPDPDALARLVLALRIGPELERSGDLVEHIAARSSRELIRPLSSHARDVVARMGAIGVDMWRRAAGTFGGVDDTTISELRSLDDELDDLHVQLCSHLAESEMPTAVAIELGLVARFFERLGDHAVNVARRVESETRRQHPEMP